MSGLRLAPASLGQIAQVCIEPVEVSDAGHEIIVSSRMSGRGKASGAPVALTLTGVCSLRDGRILRVRNYPEKAQALEAAGLSD